MGSEYAGLEFWLSSITCHASDSPIFIVGTHLDEVCKVKVNEKKLKEKFKQIVGFHYVSNRTFKGIDVLVNELVSETVKLKHIGEEIPV